MKVFRKIRWLNKLYARLSMQYWLPCPICKTMFGGHESAKIGVNFGEEIRGRVEADGRIPANINISPGENLTVYFDSIPPTPGTGVTYQKQKMVCWKCKDEAVRLNEERRGEIK